MRAARTERIAQFNDAARYGRDRTARIVMTSGLLAEFGGDTVEDSMMAQARLMAALCHSAFALDSPERDCASMDMDGIKLLVKVDYYDTELASGSEDPANPAMTRRVVTLMRPADY